MIGSFKAPKIDPKHFHYQSDGQGRDKYISQNNGGLLSQKMLKELEVNPVPTHTPMIFPTGSAREVKRSRMLLPPQHQRMVHYYGDGHGRDFYMTINDGGQCSIQNWKEHVEVAFPASLRNYRQNWSLVTAFDYLKNNPKYQKVSREKAKRQQLLSRQLSEPKLQLEPTSPPFKPDLILAGKYKSYQRPEYQTKSRIDQLNK